MSAAFDLASGPLVCCFDCKAAIVNFHRGLTWASDGKLMASAIWAGIAERHPDLEAVCSFLGHVKAHREDCEAESDVELARIKGNRLADQYAKMGAALHALPDEVLREHGRFVRRVERVVRHIGSCLSLWPTPSFVRRQRVHHGKARRRGLGHSLSWLSNSWRCSICFSTFNVLPRHPCPGESKTFRHIVEGDNGHRLWAALASDGSILIYCKLCGCSSTTKGRGLLASCAGPMPRSFGVTVSLPRIAKGRHPFRTLSLSRPWRITLPTAFAGISCDSVAHPEGAVFEGFAQIVPQEAGQRLDSALLRFGKEDYIHGSTDEL